MRSLISLVIVLTILPLIGVIEAESLYNYNEEITEQYELDMILHDLEESLVAINFEDLNQLLMISGITGFDISQLREIVQGRQINSREELLKRGFPEATLQLLDPYISYSCPPDLEVKLNSEMAYMDSSLENIRTRGKLKYGDICFGFLVDRDKDEKWKNVFHPVYIQYDCYPLQLTTGYYSLRWGQGLLHAPAFRLSYGRSAGALFSGNYNLVKPYTSSYENKFQLGTAMKVIHGSFQYEVFFSEAPVAVKYNERLEISSFPDEIGEDRIAALETNYGLGITWQTAGFRSGLLAEHIEFSHSFEDHPDWDKFNGFSGWFEYASPLLITGGEVARAGEEWAGILFTQYGSRNFRQYLLFRSYADEFPDIHGNPVSRRSDIGGEEGIYYGSEIMINRKWIIDFYTDLYHFPSARYLIDLPSGGSEQMLNLKYKVKENYVELNGRFRNAEQYHTLSDSSKVVSARTCQLQATINQVIRDFQFRTGMTWREEDIVEAGSEKQGFMIYQQVGKKFHGTRLWGRITAFRSTMPLYLYENNIKYSTKQACLNGDGYRMSLILCQNWREFLIEFKYFYERSEEDIEKGFYLGINYHLKKIAGSLD